MTDSPLMGFRVSPRDKEVIQLAAEFRDQSVSSFMREVVIDAATSTVKDHQEEVKRRRASELERQMAELERQLQALRSESDPSTTQPASAPGSPLPSRGSAGGRGKTVGTRSKLART